MTAQEIVGRIQKKLQELGIAWRSQTVDTFKAGAPATEVKGLAPLAWRRSTCFAVPPRRARTS